jgi:hypothetical protein
LNRARIEALWLANPKLTLEQVRRATGAPSATVRHVYREMLAAGTLVRERHGEAKRDFLRAV